MMNKMIYLHIVMMLIINSFIISKDIKADTLTMISNIKNAQDETTKSRLIKECSVFVHNSQDNNIEIIELFDQLLNNEKESISVRKLVATYNTPVCQDQFSA